MRYNRIIKKFNICLMIGGDSINGFEKCRRLAGLTQTDVAKALNIAQCTVSQWENGNSYPRGNMVVAVAELYHCTTDQLYGKEESA